MEALPAYKRARPTAAGIDPWVEAPQLGICDTLRGLDLAAIIA
jgi:hypothetical protein